MSNIHQTELLKTYPKFFNENGTLKKDKAEHAVHTLKERIQNAEKEELGLARRVPKIQELLDLYWHDPRRRCQFQTGLYRNREHRKRLLGEIIEWQANLDKLRERLEEEQRIAAEKAAELEAARDARRKHKRVLHQDQPNIPIATPQKQRRRKLILPPKKPD